MLERLIEYTLKQKGMVIFLSLLIVQSDCTPIEIAD